MAIRATRVGDSQWAQHRQRNGVEFWKIDDSAAGLVAAGTTIAITPIQGRKPIGVFGAGYSISGSVVTVASPALAAGQAVLVEILFEPGPV